MHRGRFVFRKRSWRKRAGLGKAPEPVSKDWSRLSKPDVSVVYDPKDPETLALLREAQDMLIEVLTERFGSVSGKLSEQIKRIDSRERLKDMLLQALRVKSFDEFGEKVGSN